MGMRPSILMLVTSHNHLAPHARTGVWLEEFVVPFAIFGEAGATMTVASPAGGDAPIEPRSLAAVDTRAHGPALDALLGTCAVGSLDPADYDAVFIPGGHGPMFDLATDPAVGRLLDDAARHERIVGAVCHGPAALVAALAEGIPLVRDRELTAFSDAEEAQTGVADRLPFSLEGRLREQGARYRSAPPWQAHVITDGWLVTGQNPASSEGVARAMLAALAGTKARQPSRAQAV